MHTAQSIAPFCDRALCRERIEIIFGNPTISSYISSAEIRTPPDTYAQPHAPEQQSGSEPPFARRVWFFANSRSLSARKKLVKDGLPGLRRSKRFSWKGFK